MDTPTDESQQGQGQEEKPQGQTFEPDSQADLAERVRHFQSLADQRDAARIKAEEELKKLKDARDEEARKELEDKEEWKQLHEKGQADLSAAQVELVQLRLGLKLRDFIAEKHPDYISDLKWIAPLVSSEEEIASVAEDYAKAHPKQVGVGAASMGNTGQPPGAQKITRAELNDPAKLAEYAAKDPEFEKKLLSGEIDIID